MNLETSKDSYEMFWELSSSGKLHLQKCSMCSYFRFLPGEYCPNCGEKASVWDELSGFGRLITWTIVHRSAHPYFQTLTPYAVGRISLDEQPELKMQAYLDISDLNDLEVGLRMKFLTADLSGDVPSIVFKSVSFRNTQMHEMTER